MRRNLLMLVLMLFGLFFLSGCGADGSYERHNAALLTMEQTDLDSPICGIRTGVLRSGAAICWGDNQFECTDEGVYYLSHNIPIPSNNDQDSFGTSSFLFFCPHDSDTMIKLCGRPDCPHTGEDCNAFWGNTAGGVCYYDGHLYIATRTRPAGTVLNLYRVNMDGSNRVKVIEFDMTGNGYSGYQSVLVIDGVFLFTMVYLDDLTGQEMFDCYYFKLDGSMREPELAQNKISKVNQEFVTSMFGIKDGEEVYHIFRADLRNDRSELIYDASGSGYGVGYWGQEAGYVLIDNSLVKVNYSNGSEEVLFDTGLEKELTPRFLPDCIILMETTNPTDGISSISNWYFYSWDGELLGILPIDFPHIAFAEAMLGGESKDRIMICTSSTPLPEYYIEKSDFRTGKINLHRYQYPDLSAAELAYVWRDNKEFAEINSVDSSETIEAQTSDSQLQDDPQHPSKQNDLWFQTDSGYLYGSDGALYPCNYTVGCIEDGSAWAFWDMECRTSNDSLFSSHYIVLSVRISIPGTDDCIQKSVTVGSKTSCGDGLTNAVINPEVEYNGETVTGTIISVTGEFYVSRQQIAVITISADE